MPGVCRYGYLELIFGKPVLGIGSNTISAADEAASFQANPREAAPPLDVAEYPLDVVGILD